MSATTIAPSGRSTPCHPECRHHTCIALRRAAGERCPSCPSRAPTPCPRCTAPTPTVTVKVLRPVGMPTVFVDGVWIEDDLNTEPDQ